jgi:hypothetical protein
MPAGATPFVARLFVAAIANGQPRRGTFRNIIGCLEKRFSYLTDHVEFS